jgi:hypothetical protein
VSIISSALRIEYRLEFIDQKRGIAALAATASI